MSGKAVELRECEKILRKNGFTFARNNGGHKIYKNSQGERFVLTSGIISQKTWRRECKRVGIDLKEG